jgi:hypothetical protein
MILQQVVGGLALDRLHDATRRHMRRDTEEQMDMFRPDVTLQNLDVMRPTDFPDQVPHLSADITAEHRLAILRDEDEMVVQTINRMGGSTVVAHGRASYRKPPEGVA